MKRKVFQLFSLCSVLVFLLTACGSSAAGKNTASAGKEPFNNTDDTAENTAVSDAGQADSTDQPASGYDILGGQLWEVSGVLVRNKIFDIHDNKDLESMYRATYLNFGSDGRFLYLDVVPKGGTYEPYETEGDYDSFLLKTDQIYQYDTDTGELVETTSGTKKPYIIYVLDDNTLEFVEFDSMTGKAKADEIPLFFAKSHEESPYVQDHKTGIAQSSRGSTNSVGSSYNAGSSAFNSDSTYSSDSSGDSNYSSGSSYSSGSTGSSSYGSNSSYQSILDTYTEKMENAVPGLISEYRSAASGISDIEKLARISNNKISKLAEICNEGVGKMAQLMNTRGDSYDTYESWAGKLMDNYSDIAQEIQDAYLDSAMN